MKKISKIHIGPIAHTILGVIAISGLVTVTVCAPNALQLLRPFFEEKKYSPKKAIERNIESLVRTGLVRKKINKNGEVALELTKRGKWEVTLRFNKDKGSKQKWDKKWRLVIFDVPNTHSKLRRELTRGMHLYGFHLLQKSVWIYPYPCDNFVKILRDHLELQKNVLYMTVDTIENDKTLQKIFKL